MKSPHWFAQPEFIETAHKRVRVSKSKIKRPTFKRPDNAKLLVKDWNREATWLLIKDLVKWVRTKVQSLRGAVLTAFGNRHKLRASPGLRHSFKKAVVYFKKRKKPGPLQPKWSWIIIAFLLGLLLARPVDTVHGQPSPQPVSKLAPAKVARLTVKRFKKIKPVYIAPKTPTVIVASVVKPQRVIAGNNYTPGNCTWYVKSKRPDIPNNWGDAYVWIGSAQASGYKTGSVPRVGAIGQAGIHVVYVERVNGNGTVYISEMNYVGLGVVSDRTVPASTFTYIY